MNQLPSLMIILITLVATPCAMAQERFAEELHAFEVDDEIFEKPECATLFVGSSSIRFWTTLQQDFGRMPTIRRGYGGSTIADTNRNFDRIVAAYRPRRIVYYAGENDINAGMSPEGVLADFEAFMDMKTRALGDAPVFFISVKPSKARINDLPAQTRANARIAALANERADLVFVDVASAMMENGALKDIFISDNLHMNARGYKIWRSKISAALRNEKASKADYCGG